MSDLPLEATARSTAEMASLRTRAIIACGVGNFFELFDFVLYGFFAVPISQAFFPSGNQALALINTFITFGVGFLFRPLGAVIIGHYGDRHGRRAALVVTVGLMAASTGFTGLVPTYASIGILAPLLLLICRCGQGFSTGGEWGGAAAFLVEFSAPGRRGLTGSWQQFSTQLGATAASLSAYLLANYMAPDIFNSWGWRVPFVAGFVLGPIGYYLRTRVAETPAFSLEVKEQRVAHAPLREALGSHFVPIVQAFGLSIIGIIGNYVMIVFMATYAIRQLHIAPGPALLATTFANLTVMTLTPFMGALSDRTGRRFMIGASSVLYFFLAYPVMLLVSHGTFITLLGAQLVVAVMEAFYTGTIPVILAEMFPTRVRYSALSVSYGFSVAIFGGFGPLVAQYLIGATGNPLSPCFLVIFGGALSAISIWSMREPMNRPLH
jgi:MHS family proline/betaine transporter-like MFS transporter